MKIKELYQLGGLPEPLIVHSSLNALRQIHSTEPADLGSFWCEIYAKTQINPNERTDRWVKLVVPELKEADKTFPGLVRHLPPDTVQQLYYGAYVKAWAKLYQSFNLGDPRLEMWEELAESPFFALRKTHCLLLS